MIIDEISKIANEIENDIVEIRRVIHRNPELAFEEFETSKIIVNKLYEIGISDVEILEGTGIVAILEGTKKSNKKGKTVMFRGDMDALPIKEQTNLHYKSLNNNMHACGHDVHVAWTLGVAIVLSKVKHLFYGKVKFVFQPGEEIGGAVKMVNRGILSNPDVDIVVAGHCWPDIKSGEIGIAQKVAMASTNTFKITIEGKGGHGANPHECIDPISIGCEIYSSIQKIISRRTNPVNPTVVSVCSFNSGTSRSTIPNICEIEGTVRAITYEEVLRINKEIEFLSQKICEIYGGKSTYELGGICLPVVNNEELVKQMKTSAVDIIDEDKIRIIHYPAMTGEDFSEYSSRKDGIFVYIGCSLEDQNNKLHSCKFDIDEKIIKKAICIFSKFIIDYLN